MRSNIGIFSIGIIGFVVIAFTIAAFFLLDIERIAVNHWALAFLLLSEVVMFGGFIALRFMDAGHNKLFLSAGASTTLTLYFVSTLISVLFAGAFRERLNTFILIEFAIIALFIITMICIFAWSRNISRQNEADYEKVGSKEPKRGGF